jgi:FlaA1/EpsC-like NDP-sugar epimerase
MNTSSKITILIGTVEGKMRILITGGTGSLGSKLAEYFYSNDNEITIFSRDGHKQQTLQRKLPDATFVLGDVCDEDVVFDICSGQDVVVHAAAQKIVYQGEENIDEFLRVNVTGSSVIARTCFEIGIHSLLISSDKACNPVNFYGKTKALAEDIFLNYGFSCLRYGNVVDSRGGFVSVWKDALKRGDKIFVRKPFPTRFFLTIDDAVMLVEDVLFRKGIFIPSSSILKAFSIKDIADAMGLEYEYQPLLPGEKQHEVLLADAEQGEIASDFLAKIWKGYNGDLARKGYSSATAPRMTGEEFLKEVGG